MGERWDVQVVAAHRGSQGHEPQQAALGLVEASHYL